MLYKNANIFVNGSFHYGSFCVENGRFTEVLNNASSEEETDLSGAYVIPGLVDIHTHGNSNADFSDGDFDGLKKMANFLLKNGITSFAPASMTLPYESLLKAFISGKRLYDEKPNDCSRLIGIHMEGPFLSENKKGAQNCNYLQSPDIDIFIDLNDKCGGLIKIVDIAPELPNAKEFIQKAKDICTISVAHTDATYCDAVMAFDSGCTHLTHLFNAMPCINHRNPGVIPAASERENVIAELICDGNHVHESVIRMAFKLFPGRICLISDAIRCCGMPDGQYELGKQKVFLNNGIARLSAGTIAGSVSTLYDCMKKAILFGIPKEQAIQSATIIPARQIGAASEIGSIDVGKYADFIVCDDNLNIHAIYQSGKKISGDLKF